MVRHKVFIIGVLAGVALCGCAGFAFRFYGLEGVRYDDGKLLGPAMDGTQDQPFSNCAPSAKEKHPCVVMFTDEFFRFRQDYEDAKTQLADCQKGLTIQIQ